MRVVTNKRNFIIWALFILTVSFISCTDQKAKEQHDIIESSMYGVLNSKAPKETHQFGQLVGKWDVISKDSIANEGWHESKATWTFKYILDGFAVQDIWHELASDVTNNTKNTGRDFKGTNIRIYDPVKKQWNMAWMQNGKNTLTAIFTANANEQGDLVMLNPNKSAEITFYAITNKSFQWKYEALVGEARILYSKMSATRIE